MWSEYYIILKNCWYGASFINLLISALFFLYTSIKDKNDNIINSIEVLRDDILKKREDKLSLFIRKIISSNESEQSISDAREKKEILIKLDTFYEYKQTVDRHFKKHHNSEQKSIAALILTIFFSLIGLFPDKYFYYAKDVAFILNIAIFIYLTFSLISLAKSKTEIRKINNDQDLKC